MMRLNDMAQNYGTNNIDSLERHICTAPVVYHFCSENHLFKILPEKNPLRLRISKIRIWI